jgi:hypothetical protein
MKRSPSRSLLLVVALLSVSLCRAFVPRFGLTRRSSLASLPVSSVENDVGTGKPTGTSFLPEETLERCNAGSPIEKIKLAKDPTAAWVDIYEYARKIREGEMSWEEVEKADLDSVCENVRL